MQSTNENAQSQFIEECNTATFVKGCTTRTTPGHDEHCDIKTFGVALTGTTAATQIKRTKCLNLSAGKL